MLVPGVDDPRRLRLGQGVKGGAAAVGLAPAPSPQFQLPKRPPPRATFTQGPPAVDVTPEPLAGGSLRPQSPEGRGAAILRRGWPTIAASVLQPDKVGPGVKKTVKLLRDPDRLFKPENKKNLDLIMRPGPKVQAIIDADPQLKANQQGLQKHIMDKGPVKLPAQDLIKNLHSTVGQGKMNLQDFVKKNRVQLMGLDDEGKQRFAAAADVATHSAQVKNVAAGKPDIAGVQAPINRVFDEGGILGAAFEQGFNTITGMVPGAIQFARHPVGTTKAIAKSEKDYYGPLFKGDFAQFSKNFQNAPLTPFMDAAAGYGAVAGASGRIGAASNALAERAAARAVETLPNGATRVGGRYTIHQMANGRVMVRDSATNKIVTSMPDVTTAVGHAQSLGSAAAHQSALEAALHGLRHPELYGKTRGDLLSKIQDHSARAQSRIAETNGHIMEELDSVLADQGIHLQRRSRQQVWEDVQKDVAKSRHEIRQAIDNRQIGKLGAHAYHELISAVRLGAIYMRPAYLPNNWAGNAFMNLTHQGFLAPVNLAKSVVMHNHMDAMNMRLLDKAMGQTASSAAYEGVPRGVISSYGQPLVHGMGKLADQPFRRAAFLHEARRAGYHSMSQVDDLFTKFKNGDQAARAEIGNIARKAQEEIVRFGHLGPKEKAIAANVFFVYNWVKGATRYAARYPLAHPIQAAAFAHLAPVGHDWVNKQMGGVPWFLAGSIPVGHDKEGNPILINPFALNPLGTSVDVARAAMGTAKALRDPSSFNKYSDSSVLDLANPAAQYGVKAITGQNPSFGRDVAETIAPWRLAQDLEHPGRGSMFPMTRQEALGHYIFGSLYPRRADQTAIERALERQNQGNPLKMMQDQVDKFQKTTGQKLPDQFLGQLKADVEAMQDMKKFQKAYAGHHGSTGFKNLPPANQAEAGLQYLRENSNFPKDTIDQLEAAVKAAPNDEVLKELSNSIWGMSGVGDIKQSWDQMRQGVETPKLTRKRN